MPVRPALPLLLTCVLLGGCASDKAMHFVAGAAASKATREFSSNPFAGCAAAFAIGLAKEAYDKRYGGVVDQMDAFATAAGCIYTMQF